MVVGSPVKARKVRRVALVLPDGRLGGAQRVLLRLATEFLGRGHAVDVVFLLAEGPLIGKTPAGARAVFVAQRDGAWLAVRGLVGFAKYLRANPSVTVLGTGTGTNILLALAKKLTGAHSRLVLREAVSVINRPSLLVRCLMRLAYRGADACVGVSMGIVHELHALGVARDKTTHIPNPVDIDAWRTLGDEAIKQNPTGGAPYVITVGRLERQKGHDDLIHAFALIADKVPHHLVIVGEGSARVPLEHLIGDLGLDDRVHLLGAQSNPHPWMRRAALFVLSSRWEGYPNVILEAVCQGCRVIATDCPTGPGEILAKGDIGTLVQPSDVVALANAIEQELKLAGAPDAAWLEGQRPRAIAERYLALLAPGQGDSTG